MQGLQLSFISYRFKDSCMQPGQQWGALNCPISDTNDLDLSQSPHVQSLKLFTQMTFPGTGSQCHDIWSKGTLDTQLRMLLLWVLVKILFCDSQHDVCLHLQQHFWSIAKTQLQISWAELISEKNVCLTGIKVLLTAPERLWEVVEEIHQRHKFIQVHHL